ncbi:hypothetical protein [Brevundimonas sp.]|uniref:hypothetical protein n=1 Tax=Brevundimonas sp. TaxID=1871086 RepID=UPI003F6F9C08
MTDFPTSNSRRPRARKPGAAGPVIGSILVFLWAFIFSVSQSFTKVKGTANMAGDLLAGICVGLLGGLLGAVIVWLIVYFVFNGRRSPKGKLVLGLLVGVAIVGALPASGFRALGAGVAAETDAINAVRDGVNARRDAQVEQISRERDALVSGGFFEPAALGAPGGLTRARTKLVALRKMLVEAEADDDRLRAQARSELAQTPVSAARRDEMLREFDANVDGEREQARITAELSAMLFDEMEAQLDILARTHWTVDYGQITFTTVRDMNAFNVRADRVDEISRELDGRERARQQRINAERALR